ncbi:MAG: dynamin family protein, partial [Rubrivivax sp.]|nr:dynamin family protein [Rubrivivax sp.]
RVVFENAAGELELWSKGASSQVELQLRERRRTYARRSEALQRVQVAASELEQRIAEVQAQDEHLALARARIDMLADEAMATAREGVAGSEVARQDRPLRQAAA